MLPSKLRFLRLPPSRCSRCSRCSRIRPCLCNNTSWDKQGLAFNGRQLATEPWLKWDSSEIQVKLGWLDRWIKHTAQSPHTAVKMANVARWTDHLIRINQLQKNKIKWNRIKQKMVVQLASSNHQIQLESKLPTYFIWFNCLEMGFESNPMETEGFQVEFQPRGDAPGDAPGDALRPICFLRLPSDSIVIKAPAMQRCQVEASRIRIPWSSFMDTLLLISICRVRNGRFPMRPRCQIGPICTGARSSLRWCIRCRRRLLFPISWN